METVLFYAAMVAGTVLLYNSLINLRVLLIYRDFDQVAFTKKFYRKGFEVKVTTYDSEFDLHGQDTIHVTFIGSIDLEADQD